MLFWHMQNFRKEWLCSTCISKKWWGENRCVSLLGQHLSWIVLKLLSVVLLVDYTKKLLLLILLFSSNNCWWKVKIPQVLCSGISVFTKVDSFILPPSSISVNCIICILVMHMKFAYLKPGKTYFPKFHSKNSPLFLLFTYIWCICSGNKYSIAVCMANDRA